MKKILFFFSLLLILGLTTHAQWQQTGLMYANGVVDALAVNGNDLFAGTQGAGLYLSSNNGNTWTFLNNGIPQYTIVASLAISGDRIFARTATGVFMSSNNGNSWTMMDNGLQLYAYVNALAVNDSNIFAGTNNGMYHSSNYGERWDSANTGLISLYVNSLAARGNYIFAGTPAGLYLSTNNGNLWTPVNNGLTDSVTVTSLVISGNSILAGTYRGIYKSSDNGSSWAKVNAGLTDSNIRTLGLSGSNIFAETGKGIYLSVNNGNTWFAVNTGLIDSTGITSFASNDRYIFAGLGNMVWKRPLSDLPVNYTVSTSANPVTGGATIGGGLFTYNQSCTVKATPGNGYAFVNWKENGLVVCSDTSFTFSVTSHRNLTANFSSTQRIKVNSPDNTVQLYPNPVTDKLTIDIKQTDGLQNSFIYVFDIQGRLMFQQPVKYEKTELNVNGFTTGVYVIKVTMDNNTTVTKFVKE